MLLFTWIIVVWGEGTEREHFWEAEAIVGGMAAGEGHAAAETGGVGCQSEQRLQPGDVLEGEVGIPGGKGPHSGIPVVGQTCAYKATGKIYTGV